MWGSEVEQQDSRLASLSTNRFRALSAGHIRQIADEASTCAPDSRETWRQNGHGNDRDNVRR